MIKLSIIVPVYNVAPYLRKCVDSLLAQDYVGYEIILVDDGSTDKSGVICDEYAAKHRTLDIIHNTCPIRVIHQDNAGLSAARNSGILAAQGDYLMFVDSDDYIEPNVLAGLMAQVECDNLDVLRYDFRNVNENYEEFHPNKAPKRDVNLSPEVTDGESFLNDRLGPGCYAWQFILRRDLIVSTPYTIHHTQEGNTSNIIHTYENKSCLFTEKIYFEDTEWTPRVLIKAKRVASTPMIVYNYLWRTGSITLPTDSAKRKKLLDDKIKLLYGFREQSRLVRDPKWFTWMTSFTSMSILDMLVNLPSFERKPYFMELKSLHVFPLSIKNEKRLSHRTKIIIANISPSLYCNLMSLRK